MLVFSNVLCLSPHQDDVEISMSGFIMNRPKTAFTHVTFSDCNPYLVAGPALRDEEVHSFWQGYSNISFKHFQADLSVTPEFEFVKYVDSLLAEVRYDAIFIPTIEDSHQHHQLINRIAIASTRNSLISVIEYRSASTLDSWTPNYFENINEVVSTKCSRLKNAFPSQNQIFFSDEYLNAFHSHLSSSRKGMHYTEQFKIRVLY